VKNLEITRKEFDAMCQCVHSCHAMGGYLTPEANRGIKALNAVIRRSAKAMPSKKTIAK
jgi:hypothetical protein